MAHDDDDALLARWLEQVGRMADEADEADERGYKAVALELGLTEADLSRVEAAVEDHLARGRNFMGHGRPADAVGELKEARALAPWRKDVAHALAEAHVARFHAEGDALDRHAAETLIRARLERDPDHQPSYTLLNRLDQTPGPPAKAARPPSPSTGSAARRRLLLVSVGGVALILLLSGLMATLMTPVEPPRSPPVETPTTPAPAPAPPADPKPAPPPEPTPPDEAGELPPEGKHDLPIEIVSWDKFAGIEIDTAGSTIDRGGYTSAWLAARVRNTADDQGLAALAGRVEFLDENGAVLGQKAIEFLNSAHSMLYPGEGAVFGRSVRTERRAVRARIILDGLERRAAKTPPTGKPICVKWGIDEPDHLAFDFALRGTRWQLGTIYLDATVHNRSENAVSDLIIQVEHYDADGALLTPSNILDKETIAASWMPPFEPGEQRLLHHMKVLGSDDRPRHDHICLRVTQAN